MKYFILSASHNDSLTINLRTENRYYTFGFFSQKYPREIYDIFEVYMLTGKVSPESLGMLRLTADYTIEKDTDENNLS